MPNEKIFEFTAAVRGFHYYRRFWVLKPSQKLNCFYEHDNPFDEFAIKACKEGHEVSVGHLPRKISRATKFFTDRGANITVTLTSNHYRRSPLVQGGMEIVCKVTASITGICNNLLLVERYKKLLEDTYTEPKNDEVLSFYLIKHEEEGNQDARETVRKRKEKILKKKEVKTKDIHQFLRLFPPLVLLLRETTRLERKTLVQ